jgi:hypothetical protein
MVETMPRRCSSMMGIPVLLDWRQTMIKTFFIGILLASGAPAVAVFVCP